MGEHMCRYAQAIITKANGAIVAVNFDADMSADLKHNQFDLRGILEKSVSEGDRIVSIWTYGKRKMVNRLGISMDTAVKFIHIQLHTWFGDGDSHTVPEIKPSVTFRYQSGTEMRFRAGSEELNGAGIISMLLAMGKLTEIKLDDTLVAYDPAGLSATEIESILDNVDDILF